MYTKCKISKPAGKVMAFLWLLAIGMAIAFSPAMAQEKENDLSTLQGYRSYSVLSSFAAALKEEPSLYVLLKQNPEFSEKVLNNASLQKDILIDIRKTGRPADVLQSYIAGRNGQDLEAAPPTRVTHQSQQRQNQRSFSSEAQQTQVQNNQFQRSQGLINQALINNNAQKEQAQQELDRVAELTKLLENHPQVLSSILANKALLRHILDRDLNLEDILAQVEDPNALAMITAGSAGTLPPGTIDVNAAPSLAEVTLDANGWPAYLQVPAGCAPPDANFLYRLENSGGNAPFQLPEVSRRGPDKGDSMFSNHNVVRSHFNRNGNWWTVNLTAREVLAAPFVTDNQEVAGFLSAAYEFVTAAGFQVAISYCPGDFREKITPPERPQLSAKCAVLDRADIRLNYEVRHADAPAPVQDSVCILEPNRRYFLNYRLHDADPALANSPVLCANTSANSSSPYPQRTVGGQTLPVCALQFAHAGRMHSTTAYPPYAGPCLENGPYPPNYNALTCGRSQQITLSEGLPLGCNSPAAYKGMNKTCYDPTNNLPPQKFVHSCSPSGTLMTWLEGYQEPALSLYVCEDTDRNGQILGQTSYPEHKGIDAPCAAHRDGETRTLSCPRTGPVTAYRQVEQCQFDQTRGRYDWAIVDQTPGTHGNRCTYSAHSPAPAYKNTCTFQGQSYSLGTEVTVTCAPSANTIAATYTASMVCEQRAEEPMLPRLVPTAGFIPKNITNHTCRATTQR